MSFATSPAPSPLAGTCPSGLSLSRPLTPPPAPSSSSAQAQAQPQPQPQPTPPSSPGTPPARMPPTVSSSSRLPSIGGVRSSSVRADDEPMSEALRVRLGLIRRVWEGVSTSERRKAFIWATALGLAMIAIIATTLGITYSRDETCSVPMRSYLVAVLVRTICAFPFSLYLAAVPPPPAGRSASAGRIAELAQMEERRRIGSPSLDRRVRRASDAFGFVALGIFFFGNWCLMKPSDCQDVAPLLWWVSLTTLLLQWIATVEILVLVLAIFFFLPFFLLAMRRMGTITPDVKGMAKTAVAALPVRVFLGKVPDEPNSDRTSPSTATLVNPAPAPTSSSPPRSARRQWSRLWRKSSSGSTLAKQGTASSAEPGSLLPLPEGIEYISLPESQSSCAICLTEYDLPPRVGEPSAQGWEPELLNVLPCAHAFHKLCLADWLVLSGRCPLCQAAVLPEHKTNSNPSPA